MDASDDRNVTWDPSDDRDVTWDTSNVFHISLYGFGYDYDYLIFLVSHDFWEKNAFMEYFSVVTNQWRESEASPSILSDPYPHNNKGIGSFLNGAIHWLLCLDPFTSIVAFGEDFLTGISVKGF